MEPRRAGRRPLVRTEGQPRRRADRPPEVARAWTAFMTNLLVLPGLGSFLVRRLWSGLAQVALSLVGVALMVAWLIDYYRSWKAAGLLPEGPGPLFSSAIAGLAIAAIGWVWAAADGWAGVRDAEAADEARRRETPVR